MIGRLSRSILVAALCVAGFAGATSALDVPPAPPLDRPIVDQTNTLNSSQIDALSQAIAKSRQEKSYQIGILLIPTLGNGEYLEGYALKVAREWGIGDDNKSDSDNGVLFLIVKDDRLTRIEAGRGLEGDLTDVRSSQILRNVVRPQFRQDNYYKGISDGVDSIQKVVSKEADPKVSQQNQDVPSDGLIGILMNVAVFGFFGLSYLVSILARSKSWWAGGVVGGGMGLLAMLASGWTIWSLVLTGVLVPFGLLFDYLVSRNYRAAQRHHDSPSWWAGGTGWYGGGGGWSSGGSGGGSFGGGDFGGGGASGDW